MKLTKTGILALVMVAGATVANAQKIKLKEGSLDALKGSKALNVSYDYSNMTVGKGKAEADYVAEKKEEYNKKEAGKGDKWANTWVSDREDRFEKRFVEEFEHQCDIKLGNSPDAKYTLIFKTTHTEPGYNVYMARKNAEIDGEALIVESGNHDKVIAKLSVENCPGRTFGGYDFDTGERLQEAYAVAGKGLGKYLKKELK